MVFESVLMDRAAIQRAIPHRPPFLFVDRVVARTERSITTEWHVETDLFAFAGHYPGNPVLPGVLIQEFCFQSAAILFSDTPIALERATEATASSRSTPVLTRVQDARFKRIVRPGETLSAKLEALEVIANARYMKAAVTSGAAHVATISFTVALVDALPGVG